MDIDKERILNNLSLFQTGKSGAVPKLSERTELVKFFVQKTGKAPKVIAIKLSHLSVQDLYYMKSVYEDLERNGKSAIKWFWWSLKHENIS